MKRKLSKKLLSLSLVFCMAGVPQSAAAQADEYAFTDAGDTAAAHDLFTAGTTGADEKIGVGKAAEVEAASSFKAPGEEVLGDGNLPFIRTAEIPSGDEGVPYTFQFEADGNGNKISWSLADGSELPEGMSLSGEGVLSGTPKEIGAYALFVQAEAGGRQSMKIFHFYINAKQEVVPDYRVTLRVDMETDFGIIEAGTTAEKSIIFENSGRKPVNFEKLPESRYFDLTVDSESEGEIAPSLGYLVKAKTKEGLKPGKYEETITVKTIEGAECTITLKVILGPASEKPYDLLCTPSDIKFTEDDFYDPEFRVEAVMKVTNAGQKNTKVTVDTSEFIHFMIDDQPAYDYEFERQDTTIALKPGQSFTYYAIPKQSYGTYEERVYFCTDDGSRFPVTVSMAREEYKPLVSMSPSEIVFPDRIVKYSDLPEAEVITIKNKCSEKVSLNQNRGEGLLVGELSKRVLEPGEKAEFTVQPEYGLGIGYYESLVSVIAVSESGRMSSHKTTTQFYVNDSLFSGVLPIAPVKNVTNGSEKTKEGLHLPETIKVYGADKASTFLTRVEWDVEGCAYEPKDKKAQTFQVQGKLKFSPGENSDNLDDKVFIEVQVNAYEPLAAPVIDGFRVIRNYVYASLWDRVNEADGYQFVAVRNAEDLVKGNFAAQCETAELSAQVKYIPQGDYLLYCRSFKEGENAKEYGAWSQGEKIQINVTTPKAPVIKKATVKNCDVLLKISTPEKVEGFDAVLARDSRGTEPLDYALVKTGYSGDSNEILLRGAAKGTYLVGIHSYQYGEGGKVLSRWSNLVKVTVKKGKVTTAPVIKKVSVSGRTITIQSAVPKGTHGYDWVLGKDCYYSETEGLLQPFNYAYVQKNKTAGKIVFKNVKPGTYYLSGHAYVKGYKKYFTNWAKPRRIVIK